ncbi:MAG TPA: hypothetical protein PLU43_05380 [Lachnospiraceae bacterium]|nr:hypothetical protein [Lachnospiraceae bacterium]
MLRKVLSNVYFIHFLVLLGLFALWGMIESGNRYLVLFAVLSLAGAVCGAFIRVIDS